MATFKAVVRGERKDQIEQTYQQRDAQINAFVRPD